MLSQEPVTTTLSRIKDMAKNSKSAGDARTRARQMHEKQLKKEKRNAQITTWSIVGVVVLVIAVIAGLLIWNQNRSIPDSGEAPTIANEHGGITLVSTTEFAEGESLGEVAANEVGESNITGEPPEEVPGGEERDQDEPAQVIIYADPDCVHCADFEMANSEFINEKLDAEEITVEYRLVNYLDNPGTNNFSSRATNTALCTAAEHPEKFNDVLTALFETYSTHQGQGLSNDELKQLASDNGAEVSDCMSNNTYRPFVDYTAAKAREGGIAGTPSIWVNGTFTTQDSFQDDVNNAIDD